MGRVAVLIDQLTRDAFSQLLVIERLRAAGVDVVVGNQGTMVSVCERTRPAVIFGSLQATGALMDYLGAKSRQCHVVLVDQEGNKPGEDTFKRAYTNSRRMEFTRFATRIFCWGSLQARWMRELGVPAEKLVVTGNPRLDPYMVPELIARRREKYVGLTFRYDLVTGDPYSLMRTVHIYAQNKGTRVGYPPWASIEDHIWHKVASARHMLMALDRLAGDPAPPLVVRPGPWESPTAYSFIHEYYPRVSIEPHALQHEYITNASVVLDDCSTLGIEALALGVPVVSLQKAIPRLEAHIGGDGKGLYDAPYLRFFWQPRTVDEAVELVRRAHRGELPLCPEPGATEYLRDIYDWPRRRPAAFDMADSILDVLGMAPPEDDGRGLGPLEIAPEWKLKAYRFIPGAVSLHALKMFIDSRCAKNRELQRRYHYFPWAYPHHRRVDELYRALTAKFPG